MKFQYCRIEVKWTLSSQSQCVTKCRNPKALGEKPGKIDMRWRYIVFLNFLPSILSFLFKLVPILWARRRKRLAFLTVSSHLMFVDKQSDLSPLVEQWKNAFQGGWRSGPSRSPRGRQRKRRRRPTTLPTSPIPEPTSPRPAISSSRF